METTSDSYDEQSIPKWHKSPEFARKYNQSGAPNLPINWLDYSPLYQRTLILN